MIKNHLKILHLPINIATQTSISIRALRDMGIDARGIILNASIYQDQTGLQNFNIESRKKKPIRSFYQTLRCIPKFLRAVQWADLIHWHYDTQILPFDMDLRIIARLHKPRVVEFWGSEIRDPDIAAADNPYMASYYRSRPDVAKSAKKRSKTAQEKFSRYGFSCLIPSAELDAYIHKNSFKHSFQTRARVMLSDFEPKFPRPDNRKPLIVHAPSKKRLKGTPAVLRAVENLKTKYQFDFKLIHQKAHEYAVNLIQACDIMIDQMNIGDYGVAALEAMALGKPTICYIKPSILKKYPTELPIVNASEDSLEDVLENMIKDSNKRNQIGQRSRTYVERHHDAHRIANKLVAIYRNLLCR